VIPARSSQLAVALFAASLGRVHSPGVAEKLSLLDLPPALASLARMRGKAPETGGAPLATTGRATLHPGGIGEPTHVSPPLRGSVPLWREWIGSASWGGVGSCPTPLQGCAGGSALPCIRVSGTQL